MNPYSNIDRLKIADIKEDDVTVILMIKVFDLPLSDLFIDDHGHYWSISKELIKVKKEKNPLTNVDFEESEWNRIKSTIEWAQKNVEDLYPKNIKITQVAPMPMIMVNDLPTQRQVNPLNNQTAIVPQRNGRNCYLTPLHGMVNGGFYCFPCCSFYNGNYHICQGEGSFTCSKLSDSPIGFDWNSPFLINFNQQFSYYPLFCCCSGDDCCRNCCFLPLLTCWWSNIFNTNGKIFGPLACFYQNIVSNFECLSLIGLTYSCSESSESRENCFTPCFCINEVDGHCKCISIFGFCVNNCMMTPIICRRKELWCLLGIPICHF